MFFKGISLVLLTVLTISTQLSALNHQNVGQTRIINGEEEEIENAPWQISLQYKEQHICGGSVYSDNIIITAAHCVLTGEPTDYQVRLGSSWHAKDGTLAKVAEIKYHEKYNKQIHTNDIALVRLAEPVTFSSTIKAIPIAKESPGAKATVTVTGWGSTRHLPPSKIPDKLQTTQLKVKNQWICKLTYLFQYDTKKQICAKSLRSSACSGDSGGPLVHNEELVGVVSFSYKFCLGPDVFTNTSAYVDWIESEVEKMNEKNDGRK